VHRKVVTVLFCDVVGSTALSESIDPEALQGLHARYFERMKAIAESLPQQTVATDGWATFNLVHIAQGSVHFSQGSLSEAEEYARQPVAVAAQSALPNVKGDSLVQLADVLAASGKHDEAIAAYSEAPALYEPKENLVAAGRIVRKLASLRTETVA
jgi:class 3 adenylate cyclase